MILHPSNDASKLSSNPTQQDDPQPAAQMSDDDILRMAGNSKNGEKFGRLWAGDWSGYKMRSAADLALCGTLAFWTGRDADRIDYLFRRSGLMRPKRWFQAGVDGQTYGQRLIAQAVTSCTAIYTSQTAKCLVDQTQKEDYTPPHYNSPPLTPTPRNSTRHFAGTVDEAIELSIAGAVTADDKDGGGEWPAWTRRIFALAQRLKGMPELSGQGPEQLVWVMQAWYDKVSAATKRHRCLLPSLAEAQAEFCLAWHSVKCPAGERRIDDVFALAQNDPDIDGLDAGRRGERFTQLAKLCRRLQAGLADPVSECFFLSQRMAGELLGVAQRVAGRYLNHLIRSGFLKLVSKGSYSGWPASYYQWTGSPPKVGGEPDAGNLAA